MSTSIYRLPQLGPDKNQEMVLLLCTDIINTDWAKKTN